ncbi:hypothetical protein ACJMK2_039645 [Sinanodonta woodiana]|uniref:BTB domain-containing protein n=1 Tax=Sinanodonta woodiana TaxID=1069815 RepID=A0ABD3WE67_SINWO
MEVHVNGNSGPSERLKHEEESHYGQMLNFLNLFRKKRQFCDAKLVVGATEIDVHRAVLSSASNYFLEMFRKSEEDGMGSVRAPQTVFKLKELDPVSFQHLLDFMYTGRLDVPAEEVKGLYKVATMLKMESAARACARHLVTTLTPENCLGIRNIAKEEEFCRQINHFIEENITEVTNSKKFYGLPKVQVEIIGAEDNVESSEGREILKIVLKWIREELDDNKLRQLTDQVNVLYLNQSNQLRDCADMDDQNLKESLVAQDYKKQKKKTEAQKQKEWNNYQCEIGNINFRKFHISPENPVQQQEWSIVASYKTQDRMYMAIAMLNGTLTALSVHYQSPQSKPPKETASPKSQLPVSRRVSLIQLAVLSNPRCAFGLKVINGKLFACGGYERGECLKSVEEYDPTTNKWTPLANLRGPRGRFNIAEIDGKIYVVGGSNGHQDIRGVDCYDPATGKWTSVTSALKPKASPGIAVLDKKIFVIGGSMGQTTVTDCEMYDPATNTWTSIAPLIMARFQVAVCGFMGKIFAVGGTNSWQCFNSTEIYDPETNTWQPGPSLNLCRRGAGIDIFNGKLYVVGGNDGMYALNSTEIYNPTTKLWTMGPVLSTPRANAGVCCLANRLYAVGGFDSKRFLDNMEYLDADLGGNEWYSHMPVKSTSDDESQLSCSDEEAPVQSELKEIQMQTRTCAS